MAWVIDTEAIAVAAKYIGIALTAGLGIIGTVTDTKDRRDDGSYKIRRVGWFVAIAIVLASLVGAIGQFYDDRAKEQAETVQILRLHNIADISRRSLLRFSGRLEVEAIFAIGVRSDPALRSLAVEALKSFRIDDSVDRPPDYFGTIQDIDCHADIFTPGSSTVDYGGYRMSLTQVDKRVRGFGFNGAGLDTTVFLNQRMDAFVSQNWGMLGLNDIVGRKIQVSCTASLRGSDNRHNIAVAKLNLLDAESRVEFGYASFNYHANSETGVATIERSPWFARLEKDLDVQ